ncbi:MAG: transposase [Ruminococcus sp.]|nr:transposase [Ruminococcus sp.]
MKNKMMDLYDRPMLRKRAVIESVNDFLKNICDTEHSKQRSVTNFIVNLISALAAYSFLLKKLYVCSDIQEVFLCLLD